MLYMDNEYVLLVFQYTLSKQCLEKKLSLNFDLDLNFLWKAFSDQPFLTVQSVQLFGLIKLLLYLWTIQALTALIRYYACK